MSTKFEKHLKELCERWFQQRKMMSREDFKMLKDLCHEKVNK